MGKRLFVAIDLPGEVNQELGTYAEVLRDVRWYQPSQYHLTVKFIGESGEEKYQNIQERLDDIRHSSFFLTVNKLGYFPPDKHPRVLWAGFEPSEPLQQLHQKIESALHEIGIEKEDRSFTPHVTLGKNKGVPRTRVEEYIENRSDIYIPEIPVESFILYSSELTPEGAVHTPEHVYYLND